MPPPHTQPATCGRPDHPDYRGSGSALLLGWLTAASFLARSRPPSRLIYIAAAHVLSPGLARSRSGRTATHRIHNITRRGFWSTHVSSRRDAASRCAADAVPVGVA